MKLLRGIFRLIVGVIIAVYASLLLVSSLPVVQRWLVRQAQDVVSDVLDTRVAIGHFSITPFGYIQLDSVLVEDRLGYPMLFVTRANARISFYELLYKTVNLEHAQFYGMLAALRQERADSAWNFQFVVDALSGNGSNDNKSPWPITLNSIIVRRGAATVDRAFIPAKDEGFDINHLALRQLSLNARVSISNGGETMHVAVNRFTMAEQSGLRITELNIGLSKLCDEMALSQFVLRMPRSVIGLTANTKRDTWNVRATTMSVDPDDIVPALGRFGQKGMGRIDATLVAYGDTANCHIDTLQLRHDAFHLFSDVDVQYSPLRLSTTRTTIDVNVPMLAQRFQSGYHLPTFCAEQYPLSFEGVLAYSEPLSAIKGQLVSPQGALDLDATIQNGDEINVSMKTPEFDLSPLLAQMGKISLDMTANGSVKRKSGILAAHIPAVTYNGRVWHNITLQAEASDSLTLGLTVADPCAVADIDAVGYPSERRVVLNADVQRLCPDALTSAGAFDTVSYSGRVMADMVIPSDPIHSSGRLELRNVLRNDMPLTDSIVLTVANDSLQQLRLQSDFMAAHFVTSDLRRLMEHREDSALKAGLRLWNEAPLDSVLGIKLALLDTLRVDADGSTGALVARLGFDSMLKDEELHVGAVAGYKKDSVWTDLTLQSPIDDMANGRVQAHTSLNDSLGWSNIYAKVHNLNVGYIMNLVNFHSVEFDGWASGDVEVSRLNTSPFIDGLLDIRELTFNEADMGDLDLHISFDTETGTLGLDGLITDPKSAHTTHAYGYVRPGHRPNSGMDLYIDTRRINAAFINSFTEGIFENVQGRASGTARVYGKFSQIDLYGDLKIDELSLQLPVLGTGFYAKGDSVHLRPGLFDFPSIHITDGRGGTATVQGALCHTHFSNMNYDFHVAANNLLGYRFDDFGDMPFYATAYASGTVDLKGAPGRLDVSLSVRPEKGTVLVYNTSSPSAATNDNFITYGAISSDTLYHDIASARQERKETSSTDIRIMFNLDITKDAQLHIITDAVSGDAINLYGTGNIMASYYNKGAFRMYGQYLVDHGDYNLSIQGFWHKQFQFNNGGTLTFGGSPMQGDLNLQAVYPVPNVSLSDLSAKAAFGNHDTRVDCIMNLTGKCEAPRITFDFDMPNVNEDEKQMVRSLISTEEERNMQVLYLLGIGRFYSYDYAGSSAGQSNVAMKSLLSSTLSSTLNNVFSNAIGSNNWSFGTSIATGDVGWSDMDVEGLVAGRLFNNRLLVNGQFGYRDRTTTGSNFIGDFDLKWLLTHSGNIAIKAYSETNDRYFTKSSLTTQGVGLVLKKDFNRFGEIFKSKKQNKTKY